MRLGPAVACVGASVLLLATSCVSPPDSEVGDGDGKPCRNVRGTPVSERALKRAFAARGIVLRRDDCVIGRVVSLSNINDDVSSEEEDAIRASEGHISCDLSAEGTDGRIERFAWRNDPYPVTVRVLNVDCSVYPERRAHTDAVEAALRTLPGVSDAPSRVPSRDAGHD